MFSATMRASSGDCVDAPPRKKRWVEDVRRASGGLVELDVKNRAFLTMRQRPAALSDGGDFEVGGAEVMVRAVS